MITYDARWTDGREILPEHREFPVRQVYVWVQADAEKVVLVSKKARIGNSRAGSRNLARRRHRPQCARRMKRRGSTCMIRWIRFGFLATVS